MNVVRRRKQESKSALLSDLRKSNRCYIAAHTTYISFFIHSCPVPSSFMCSMLWFTAELKYFSGFRVFAERVNRTQSTVSIDITIEQSRRAINVLDIDPSPVTVDAKGIKEG